LKGDKKNNTIKCSQCEQKFPGGLEYRMHWEKEHLEDALNQIKKNEGERINSNKKSSKEYSGSSKRNNEPDAEPKRYLDRDARDLKEDAWIPKSSRSTKGGYTNRFWEED